MRTTLLLVLLGIVYICASESFQTRYFTQTIDHFHFEKDDRSYQQRYLISDKYWNQKGPILFYCGNEADVEVFWNNSGFITFDLASNLNALVVFAEHRYYGLSLPFGSLSFSKDNIQYLTTEQVVK